MRSYARNQGTQASAELMRQDVKANDSADFDLDTVYSYLGQICAQKQPSEPLIRDTLLILLSQRLRLDWDQMI